MQDSYDQQSSYSPEDQQVPEGQVSGAQLPETQGQTAVTQGQAAPLGDAERAAQTAGIGQAMPNDAAQTAFENAGQAAGEAARTAWDADTTQSVADAVQPTQDVFSQATQQVPAQPTQAVPAQATQAVPAQAAQPAASQASNSWYEAAHARAQARDEGTGAYAQVHPAQANRAYAQPEQATSSYARPAGVEDTQSYARPTQDYSQPTQSYAQPAQGSGGSVPPRMPGTPKPSPAPSSYNATPSRPKKQHVGIKALLLGLLGGVLGAAAIVAALYFTGNLGSTTTVTTTSTSGQTITIDPADEDTSLASVVAAKALPSVVSINVVKSTGTGVGSGVILDTDGNILTNYHVIESATAISVTANDESYEATVVGSDESSDLAVVKIDPGTTTLTPIEVGDSSALQVGDWVMSIGSPFGLDQSVSTGIVSSLYRSTMLSSTSGNSIYTNLIQTDATINPGNSGGALVDSEGKLVGINSLIESYSGSSSGVGFAIPGNYAVEVANTIIAGETVTHAYLGGSFQTVTAQNALSSGLSVNQGAYVAQVTSGGPAEAAGIQVGDVITAIDDEKIVSSDGVVLAVRSHSVGDTVTVTFMRGTEEMSVSVTLGSDEALQESQEDTSSQEESLLEQYLNQYGYGNGSSGSDGYGSNGSGLDGYGNSNSLGNDSSGSSNGSGSNSGGLR